MSSGLWGKEMKMHRMRVREHSELSAKDLEGFSGGAGEPEGDKALLDLMPRFTHTSPLRDKCHTLSAKQRK